MHSILTTSLVMFALVLGIVLSIWQGWLPGGAIYLEVKMEPATIKQQTIFVPVRLILHNPSGQTQYFKPQNVCKIFRWFILDQKSAFVQALETDPDCDPATINRALKPWASIEETHILQLDAKRFQRNQTYLLALRFWGLDQQVSFTPITP